MVNVSIARRYARALLEAAGPAADQVLAQVDGFVALLASSPELADVVDNPAYTRAQKMKVVEALVQANGATNPQLVNALKLLVDRSRLNFLPDIARLYRDLVDVKLGRVRGRITSAVPLAPDALAKLSAALKVINSKDILLESKVDPKILGGVMAQVGSTVFDGSLRTQLDELGRGLKSGRNA
jgi:F-type H+-transporting ATPase subunit delta